MQARGRVIVGVSGSTRNMAAVSAATAAAVEADKTLVAITAWVPLSGDQVSRRYPCQSLDYAVDQAMRDNARTLLFDALANVPPGVDVEAQTVRGYPASILVAAAADPNDLLVVGAGRRGRLRLTCGAVTRYCVSHAACPVLAVPEPELIRDLGRIRRKRRVTVPDFPDLTGRETHDDVV